MSHAITRVEQRTLGRVTQYRWVCACGETGRWLARDRTYVAARGEQHRERSEGRHGRGTSNGNARGNNADRRRRREWLVTTYRADVDVPDFHHLQLPLDGTPLGQGEPACRCYRCGALLTLATVTIDRVVPGCQGGTYARTNIRPACGPCNSETGGRTRGT